MPFKSALVAALLTSSLAAAQQTAPPPVALTIYNQNFAVARTSVDLNLHPGINEVTTTRVTSQLEPDSVVLRDPTGQHTVHVVEQNYDAAVVNQQWMLKKYEGRTISFQISPGTLVQGKIIRAGDQSGQYPGQYEQPLIEVNGLMQFQLPGTPLFPASTDGLLLKPTLRWQIQSPAAEHYIAELAYITGGLDWQATYNIVAPQSASIAATEKADVLGWVTIHNQSGSDFPSATIKLMAGDVAKIMPSQRYMLGTIGGMNATESVSVAPQVTQKAFDDFHLYNLNRTVTLRDGETKQVQFLDAPGVTMQRTYSYDGAALNRQPYENYSNGIIWDPGYGLDSSNTKVNIVEQIKNSKSNHLGIPLPAGRVRVYRRDSDGQMEFVGESMIEHTSTEETLKIITGNAFDIKGSRKQTEFHVNQSAQNMDETFQIKLTNQKPQPVEVNVVEHLYRGNNWQITAKSSDYIKRDSHTIEFPVQVPAKGESTVVYTVHYTW